jgi:hypothetical protein
MLSLVLALLACKSEPVDTGTLVVDLDGDGFSAEEDCDDSEALVFPGGTEICDGLDNDCDGTVDNGASDAFQWFGDADGDGFGDPAQVTEACSAPVGYVPADGDCDDADSRVYPTAPEADCTDPIDYNCDGSVGYADADGDGTPACEDCDDGQATAFPGGTEICDGIDNDCDGDVDDSATDASTWYIDYDADGYGSAAYTEDACEQPVGYTDNDLDCDDSSALALPGGVEVCDGLDNDCNGDTDEDSASDALTFYADTDSDGYGDPSSTQVACEVGSGFVEDDQDCDDTDSKVNPAATEICDTLDNDCDGATDDASASDATTWYIDYDSDGYGTTTYTTQACSQPTGYASSSNDCDDTSALASPGVTEICDEIDNNCDGDVDEDSASDATTWYLDLDLDGYGDPSNTSVSCVQPSGTVTDFSDCDDSDIDISPDADEVCDAVDNNCDGFTDEDTASDADTWYADSDGDGYGDPDSTTQACDQPTGYVSDNTDCDDTDATSGDCTICTISSVSTATSSVNRGSTYGAWMRDPLETLGSGLVWEMDSYGGSTLLEYPSEADMVAGTSSTSSSLTYGWDGTGHAVYDGYLYYNKAGSNTLIEYDLSTNTVNSTLSLSSAGYRNTYHYQWGGYSDIDFASDENGLWVLYGTSSNSGKMVISSLSTNPLAVDNTWNTASATKTSIGNAFMTCGVMYATNSYSSGSATINYAYDTNTSTDSNPSILAGSFDGYLSSLQYDPVNGVLYGWDRSDRVEYTVSY